MSRIPLISHICTDRGLGSESGIPRIEKVKRERGRVPFTLSLLIYFSDILLHSTEFLAMAFSFAFRMWNKKAKLAAQQHAPTRTKTVNIHLAPVVTASAVISFRLRDSNPCLPHAGPTRYRLSRSLCPVTGVISVI